MSVQSALLKLVFSLSDKSRDRGLSIPGDVEYHASVPFGSGGTLDICYPAGTRVRRPVIISFHGGGYVYGNAKLYSLYASSMARRGFAVVNFNYRLAPKYRFPAPIIDANEAILWACDHAESYCLDTDNVFFVGDSAGAQLASQYAAIYANSEYAGIMGVAVPDFRLRAIALNCGIYDLKRAAASGGLMADYLTKTPEIYGRKLDVLSYIDANYPPVFIMSAPGDFLCGECEPMAALLRGRGVETECVIYGDGKTGHVFHLDVRNETGIRANDDEAKFFMRHMT